MEIEPGRPRPGRRLGLGTLALALACVACAISSAGAQSNLNLTEDQVSIVVQRLADGASQSWEFGTREQALLELNTPAYSVLTVNDSSSSPLVPPSSTAPSDGSLDAVFNIIAAVVANRSATISSQNLSDPQPFFPSDGAAGDPASNGVAALIANLTGQSNSSINYGDAASSQLQFLFEDVPRAEDGAISHRVSQLQLWSDFVYMVPPFLAYYGVLTENKTLIEQAYTQIADYRDNLRDESTGLWMHIVNGSDFQDYGLWSTGNGWAAAGMLRVLGTMQNSQYKNTFKNEINTLRDWVNEIHDGMYTYLRSDGLFNNYVNDSSTFADSSSATLVASTVYRTALLTKTYKHLPHAETVRKFLWSASNNASSYTDSSSMANMTHFTSEGWLTPVVNPESFGNEGSESPEGQAFVVMMYSAWRDWVAAGSVGANSGRRTIEFWGPTAFVAWTLFGTVVALGFEW